MNKVKKGFIIAGAAIGGVLGGTISTIGKLANVKVLDELGNAVIDSTILTGTIAGRVVSGTADIAVGKTKKSQQQIEQGKTDLKEGTASVVKNWTDNFHLIVDNSGTLVEGIKEKDKEKIVAGTKTLGKIAAVGMMTVGAIKIDDK